MNFRKQNKTKRQKLITTALKLLEKREAKLEAYN